jgi:hypothetical protein
MNLNFESLFEHYMDMFFLTENLQYSVLKRINSNVIAILKRESNLNRQKIFLKPLSKDLILHITNGNFENITDDFLPNLKDVKYKKNDLEFKHFLEKELSNLSLNNYKNFWKKISMLIVKISNRNNSEFEYLKKLRPEYIMSY